MVDRLILNVFFAKVKSKIKSYCMSDPARRAVLRAVHTRITRLATQRHHSLEARTQVSAFYLCSYAAPLRVERFTYGLTPALIHPHLSNFNFIRTAVSQLKHQVTVRRRQRGRKSWYRIVRDECARAVCVGVTDCVW